MWTDVSGSKMQLMDHMHVEVMVERQSELCDALMYIYDV